MDVAGRVMSAVSSEAGAPALADGGQVPADAAPQPTAAVAVTPAPAVAVATPAVLTSADGGAPLDAEGDDAPLAAPLAWAALAAARREDLTGASPEVAPAATVSTAEVVDPGVGAAAQMTIMAVIPTAPTGSQVVITGSNFAANKNITYSVNSVKFGCSSNSGKCPEGIEATIDGIAADGTQITVTVPEYAASGYVRVAKDQVGASSVNPVFAQFTVQGAPTISSSPSTVNLGDTLTISGANFGSAPSVKFNGSPSTTVTVTAGGTEITAVVPLDATAGKIQISAPNGTVTSAQAYTVAVAALPALPTCTSQACQTLDLSPLIRTQVINQIATAVATALSTAGPALPCTKNGCPIPGGQTAPSVADTIGMYAYNIIYSLAGPLDADVVGEQVANLASQPNLLTFISDTVSKNAVLAALPSDVAATVGNAAATFVQNAFVLNSSGYSDVGTALAPFLYTLGVPTTDQEIIELGKFLNSKNPDGTPKTITQYLLTRFNTQQGQQALIDSFFSVPAVQQSLGGALSAATEVLLGLAQPSWPGATQTNPNAIANYLGQTVAGAVLGSDNPGTAALAATIGTAAAGLISAIGDVVAGQAGDALVTLLQQPALDEQPAVATTLAGVIVNQLVAFLGGTAPFPLPDGLLPALAPGAGIAATGLVNALLADTSVDQALGTFVSQLTTGVLADPGVQQLVGQGVAGAVSGFLGGPLGQAVGARAGAAAAALVSNPAVGGAVATLVDSVFGGLLGATGVETALADAAGGLVSAVLGGEPVDAALKAALAALGANPDVDAAVGPVVSTAVARFLADSGVWSAVDAEISSLVTGLIADPTVQQALNNEVAAEVSALLGRGDLGQVVGAQVGAAVVALVTNPIISGALVDVADTVFTDFFSADGVVDAVAGAAGDVARAVLAGESVNAAVAAAGAALRANPDVDAGIQASVGDAVAKFLGDAAVWSTIDTGITSLVATVIADPLVQQALSTRVTDEVSALLGGDLGQVVGAQVAATVLQLVNDPTVGTAVLEIVDTVFADLFGAPGVVDAFAGAAGDLALAVVTGEDVNTALTGIVWGLRNNPAVDAGVQASVGDAVAQFLNDTAVWPVVDNAAAALVGELLADTEVQQALNTRVADEVSVLLGGDLGQVVGAQVAAVVVGLVTNPVVTDALVDVVDTMVTDFLDAPGVVDALSGAAGDIALAVLTGESVTAAARDALSALEANAAIQAGVQVTVADAFTVIDTEVLSSATFQQDLGTAVTGLINELAADQVVQQYVTDRYGAAVGGLLADTAVVGEVASAVGSALTQLLGYSGVSTALTDAADQFVDAVLAGTDTGAAAQAALKSIQTAPSVVAAVNAVIPPILNTLLDTTDVRQAIGVVAQQATIARLDQSWFHIAFLDRMIGQVAKGTVEDFLTRTAGRRLVDDVVVHLVLGMPVSDATDFVVDEVLRKPGLQIALGFSLGAGIGSLFGDNILGEVIGWVSGFPATIAVGVAAVVIGVYEWIVGLVSSVIDGIAGPAQSGGIPYPEARIA